MRFSPGRSYPERTITWQKDSQKLSKKTAEEPKDLSNPDEILEEDELDEDPEEGEPPVSEVSEASDTTLDEDKIEAGIDEEEDLLEGIPEEELKATTDVQLPKVTTARSKRRATRKRANDGGVTMLTGDPVRMYLKEIGKVPLLTAAEEIDLAMKIEAGVAAGEQLEKADAGEIELERRDLRRLTRIEEVGFDAKQQLIEANLRLVVSIAKRYVGRGMLFLDLIQEGNLASSALSRSSTTAKGFKFSGGCQAWWITGHYARAIADQARTIRIPVHMVETINKLRAHPAPASPGTRSRTDPEGNRRCDGVAWRVREIQKISQEPVSFETPIGEEEDSQLGDFIEDDAAVVPPDAASFSMLQEQLGKVLDGLAERERKVISLRFGLKMAIRARLRRSDASSASRERIRDREQDAREAAPPEPFEQVEGLLGRLILAA